jgi:signal transduction histidine kinase
MFLATLGHDLRAPLNAIMLSAQLVARSGRLDDEHATIATRIPAFVNTMTSMIQDLLDFTRTRLGRGIPVSLAPVDLGGVCREVLVEFRAAHPHRAFRYAADGDLRGEWDAPRLRQVLSNLVANALEHGAEKGEIAVTASSAGPDVLLTVQNEGPPIPPSALPTLFNPFVRAATKLRSDRRAEGVGLGLFISQEIVTAHGGTITVASSEADGTVFSVCLPRKPPAETRAPDA